MDLLTEDDRGEFVLETETGSRYEISLSDSARVMNRVSAPTGVELRRDGEPVVIASFAPVRVGASAIFGLEPLSQNGALATVRRTSAVTSITRCA